MVGSRTDEANECHVFQTLNNWALVRGDNSGTSQSRREKNTGQRPGALGYLRAANDESNYS